MIPGSPFGILAEFEEPEQLVEAARCVRAAGYKQFEAYSPFPVEGLSDAVGFQQTGMPWITLIGGVIGGVLGYGLLYWVSVSAYPLNVGGRPLNSWPMFIPITFECVVLVASLFCVFGMLALNGLPRPYHPLFEIPEFARATQDRFFLCVLARDKQYDEVEVQQLLASVHAARVTNVQW